MVKINLFNKDKELILKITNGILVIWLIGSIIFTGNNIVNLLIREPELTYNQYELKYCVNKEDAENNDQYCQRMYDSFMLTEKDNIYYQKRNLYTSIINIIAVGTGLLLLNKKKIEKK